MNTQRLGRLSMVAVVLAMLLALSSSPNSAAAHPTPIQVRLQPVGGSGVSGIVRLQQRPKGQGTHINVLAFGLKPDDNYVSLYYSNHVCELEPYSVNDVIGGIYTANRGGVGTTKGNVDDNLNKINSVSVRQAGDFKLVACADVHRHK